MLFEKQYLLPIYQGIVIISIPCLHVQVPCPHMYGYRLIYSLLPFMNVCFHLLSPPINVYFHFRFTFVVLVKQPCVFVYIQSWHTMASLLNGSNKHTFIRLALFLLCYVHEAENVFSVPEDKRVKVLLDYSGRPIGKLVCVA